MKLKVHSTLNKKTQWLSSVHYLLASWFRVLRRKVANIPQKDSMSYSDQDLINFHLLACLVLHLLLSTLLNIEMD